MLRLSNTIRTAETAAEYAAMPKSRQDEIKDVGGFVGGAVIGGRRNAHSVPQRQLLTLDLDFARADVWDNFTLLYGNAAVMYGTHKCTPERPRLRLVMPLSRAVDAEEYMALGRHVADTLGREMFDESGFEPWRLMYWPSTSADVPYVFHVQQGDWADVDELLFTYYYLQGQSAAKDVAAAVQAPASALRRNAAKLQDPCRKSGVVGEFCRAYNIHEAIARFLPDVYVPSAIRGRYTYTKGTTEGGLVTYEDKFAYSHHGTDPARAKLLNAFDLVRLHHYGALDKDMPKGVPAAKLPSFRKMALECEKEKVKSKNLEDEQIINHTSQITNELELDKKGNITCGLDNVVTLLLQDEQLKDRMVFDEFEQREIVINPFHWRHNEHGSRQVKDSDIANLKLYLKTTYGMTVSTTTVEDALKVLYDRKRIHSVKDYLKAQTWDEVPRLDTLLIDYLGAADSAYTRAVTRKTLVAAVARVYCPGVKFDNMLTLVGRQGIGKSTLINRLGGRWFSDSFNFHMLKNGKEGYEQLQGAWLIEVGELAGFSKADVEVAKSFLSKQEDRYRVSYGRRVESFPRQCVFIGTTNNNTFLRDLTGNRRFWPVLTEATKPVYSVFAELDEYEVNQLWAEAVRHYHHGEPLHLDAALSAEAERIQSAHTEEDDRKGIIQQYLDMPLPEHWDQMDLMARRAFVTGEDRRTVGTIRRKRVCAAELWCECLGKPKADMNRFNTKELHDIMRGMEGWREVRVIFTVYGQQRGYERLNEV